MAYSTPEQLSFPPVAGHTLRADFEGGALSSDFGVLLLRGIDRQIGLTARLAAAIHDTRHPSYIDHPLRDLLAQRIYQIASGYADGNDGAGCEFAGVQTLRTLTMMEGKRGRRGRCSQKIAWHAVAASTTKWA